MFLKIKEISLQTIKRMNQNTKQNKREQNHKIGFFLTTEKIEVVGMGANLHYFPIASENRSKDKISIATNQRYLNKIN